MKLLLTILTFLSVTLGFSQKSELVGTFWADSTHYVEVSSNNTIEYFSPYGCCLLTEVYGFGTYEINDNIIRVTPTAPKTSMNSNHQIVQRLDQKDKIQLSVMDSNEPIKYCNVVIKDQLTQKILLGASTNDIGLVEFTAIDIKPSENLIIEISSLGMDSYSLKLDEVVGKSIMVDLKPFRVIRDEIVEFKISKENESIYLIGPIFPDDEDGAMSGKDKIRMVFSSWPWNWNFSHTHVSIPTQFEKIKN